ncbi:MAG: hypothetical protein ACPGIC_07330 [Opitutales bacterium]
MSKIKKEMSPRVTPAGLPAFRSIHDMMSTLTAAISLGNAVAIDIGASLKKVNWMRRKCPKSSFQALPDL